MEMNRFLRFVGAPAILLLVYFVYWLIKGRKSCASSKDENADSKAKQDVDDDYTKPEDKIDENIEREGPKRGDDARIDEEDIEDEETKGDDRANAGEEAKGNEDAEEDEEANGGDGVKGVGTKGEEEFEEGSGQGDQECEENYNEGSIASDDSVYVDAEEGYDIEGDEVFQGEEPYEDEGPYDGEYDQEGYEENEFSESDEEIHEIEDSYADRYYETEPYNRPLFPHNPIFDEHYCETEEELLNAFADDGLVEPDWPPKNCTPENPDSVAKQHVDEDSKKPELEDDKGDEDTEGGDEVTEDEVTEGRGDGYEDEDQENDEGCNKSEGINYIKCYNALYYETRSWRNPLFPDNPLYDD